MPRLIDIRVRAGTAAAWTAANPTLNLGEPGYETDTFLLKIGDGVTAWVTLPYGPRAQTQTAGDSSTKIASTAFVTTAIAAIPDITSSFLLMGA